MQRYEKGGNFITIVIIIIAAIPLWLPVMLLTVDKYYFTPTRNIETNWNIDIPSGFKQIYHTSSDNIYARGDGYTVYETSGEVSTFLEGFYFVKQPSVESHVKEVIIRLLVSEDYHPPFEESYYYLQKYLGKDSLVIVCFPKTNQCFFVESFSWDR